MILHSLIAAKESWTAIPRLLACALCLALAAFVQAATINVDGSCKFEDALEAADKDVAPGNCPAGSGADTIVLQTNVTLTRTLEPIDTHIEIEGGGYTVDGAGKYPFVNNQKGEVSLNNLTLTNAYADENSVGWVIYNGGKMTIANSVLINNSASAYGGVIGHGGNKVADGALTISNTTISTTSAGDLANRGIIAGLSASGSISLSHVTLYTQNYIGLHLAGDTAKLVSVRNSIIAGDFWAQCYLEKGPSLFAEFVGNVVAHTNPATGSKDIWCENRVRDARLDALTGSPAYYPLKTTSPGVVAGTEGNRNWSDWSGTVSAKSQYFDCYGRYQTPVPDQSDDSARAGRQPGSRPGRASLAPTREPYSACEAFTDTIIVRHWNLGAQCQATTTDAAIGDARIVAEGWIMAVDIWGWLDKGVEVCFEAVGKVTLLDAAFAPRAIVPLPAYAWQGHTCAWVDRPGNVILQASDEPAPESADSARPPTALSDCVALTKGSLYLRQSPGGAIIGGAPNNALLTALERTAGWFKVDYHGTRGWISANYVEPRGLCG